MLTRFLVTLTLVAFVGVPSALAGCGFDHNASAQSEDTTASTQQSTPTTAAADVPQSTAPADTPVTVAGAPENKAAQD